MSGSISFDQIPATWNVPGAFAEVTTVNSGTTLAGMPLRALIVGVLGSGTGRAGVVYPNISKSSALTLAGAGSLAARAVSAFITDAPFTQLDLVLVSPLAGSVAQIWTVTPSVSGSGDQVAATSDDTAAAASGATPVVVSGASASGQIALIVGGVRVVATVSSGMTAAALGAALAAAFTSDIVSRTGVTCTLNATSGALTLTALEKGGWTADIDVRQSVLAADTVPGVALAVGVTTPGAGWPDMTPALSAVAHTWYTDIVSCLYDATNLATFSTELTRRFNAMVKLDALGYVGFRGTYGQTLALAETLNNPHLTVLPANAPRWEPAVAAASYAAVASAALNTDPARQLRSLSLTALAGLGPDDADRFDMDMRNVLLGDGMSTFLVGSDGTVTIERAVSTETADANGNATTAWADVMAHATISRIRYEWNYYIETTYPRAKLADDGDALATIAGAGVVTPTVLKNSWAGQSALYENAGWLENTATLAKSAIFQIDATDKNRVNCALPVDRIGALIVVATSIQMQV
ncbi:phage tail protein [Acetobacter sicerae]|uniref:Phage tail protein n=1 Tax=Acetobacter sicerae TaxID=85325 RepID=A0ABS8VZJ2_9PROT|nr:phage tail protein [Acetobacter sicerae]MCE0744605.1 phage tail protein [Acetobacter sicerae]